MKAIVLLVVGGFLILVPQWFVYSGNSLAGRYLTPGNLFIVFAAALGLYLCSNNFVERDRAKLRGIVVGMLIAVTLYRLLGTYREANAAALATYKFQKKLAEIVALKTQHPALPLLFYSTNVSDREALVSVARFLAVRLPNPERPFLNPFNWEAGADSPRKIRLAKRLREESLENDGLFAKISDFHGSNGRCIAVIFSGFTENFQCAYSVRVRES
jgi:heme A synthase